MLKGSILSDSVQTFSLLPLPQTASSLFYILSSFSRLAGGRHNVVFPIADQRTVFWLSQRWSLSCIFISSSFPILLIVHTTSTSKSLFRSRHDSLTDSSSEFDFQFYSFRTQTILRFVQSKLMPRGYTIWRFNHFLPRFWYEKTFVILIICFIGWHGSYSMDDRRKQCKLGLLMCRFLLSLTCVT